MDTQFAAMSVLEKKITDLQQVCSHLLLIHLNLETFCCVELSWKPSLSIPLCLITVSEAVTFHNTLFDNCFRGPSLVTILCLITNC